MNSLMIIVKFVLFLCCGIAVYQNQHLLASVALLMIVTLQLDEAIKLLGRKS